MVGFVWGMAFGVLMCAVIAVQLTNKNAKENAELRALLTSLADHASYYIRRRSSDGGVFSGVALADAIEKAREALQQ